MSMAWSNQQKLEAINRELGFRRTVYARRVADKRMSQKQSDDQISIFEAIRDDYEQLAASERLI